ncbi:MAG: DUF2974 domain-containing protein [Treponema sp.]|jgi:hypothetical protein|nr:DUF2974 domain-containing protein [Treponema sp.]
MANQLDYVIWRGDIPLRLVPFNEVDAIILCQISYLDLDGIVSGDFKTKLTLADAAARFEKSEDFKRRSNTGAMINSKTVDLFLQAGKTERFGTLKLCGYVSRTDISREEQFSAVTALLTDGSFFTAFRGTDDSIVGWKEDFNLGFMETVPAQKDAADYINRAASVLHGKIRIGGHSKGGNLAIYSAAWLNEKYRRRLTAIYNNDGPGFPKDLLESRRFTSLVPQLHSFYPRFSIVGMLFRHFDKYTVVESDQDGIMQHDPFSWHVNPCSFVTAEDFEEGSIYWDRTLNTWFESLTLEQREQFVETIFGLLQVTDARTNSELEANWLKNSPKIVKALASIDSQTRDGVMTTIRLLFKIAKKNLPEIRGLKVFSK